MYILLNLLFLNTQSVICCVRELCASLIKEKYEKRAREVKEAGSSCMDGAEDIIMSMGEHKVENRADALEQEELMDEQASRADQRRIELLSGLDEEHQERLQVLADVFQKAQERDLPAEVW